MIGGVTHHMLPPPPPHHHHHHHLHVNRPLGSLQLAIYLVQNRHVGEQKVALGQNRQRILRFEIMYVWL